MKKIIFLFLVSVNLFSQEFKINLQINNVKQNKGKIFIAVYNKAESYKKQVPDIPIIIESKTNPLSIELSIPKGDYVFSVFQDINNNNKLDTNLVGMPKEPVGISNFDGKGIPGTFKKLKMKIDKDTKVTINLIEI